MNFSRGLGLKGCWCAGQGDPANQAFKMIVKVGTCPRFTSAGALDRFLNIKHHHGQQL